jgi:hypothetical protein
VFFVLFFVVVVVVVLLCVFEIQILAGNLITMVFFGYVNVYGCSSRVNKTIYFMSVFEFSFNGMHTV